MAKGGGEIGRGGEDDTGSKKEKEVNKKGEKKRESAK